MSKYGNIPFKDYCTYERNILEDALNRRKREYDDEEESWISYACSKEESIKIALEVFDGLAYHAKEFSRSARAMEILMKKHGLELGKEYSIQEYIEIVEQLKMEEEETPNIRLVK